MADEPQTLVAELAARLLDSFEKLEALLAIERGRRPRTLDELATELRVARPELEQELAALVAGGALTESGGSYTLPANGPWTPHVHALAAIYESDRMMVVTTMSKAALERVREQAARTFADAFVVRGKGGKKGEGDG